MNRVVIPELSQSIIPCNRMIKNIGILIHLNVKTKLIGFTRWDWLHLETRRKDRPTIWEQLSKPAHSIEFHGKVDCLCMFMLQLFSVCLIYIAFIMIDYNSKSNFAMYWKLKLFVETVTTHVLTKCFRQRKENRARRTCK